MSTALSVSPLSSRLSVVKKTFEPSLEAPTNKGGRKPGPCGCETQVVAPPERS